MLVADLPSPEQGDINVLCLVKCEERYVLLYTAETRSEALRQLGLWAMNPSLNFCWQDAAVLSQRIREAAKLEAIP